MAGFRETCAISKPRAVTCELPLHNDDGDDDSGWTDNMNHRKPSALRAMHQVVCEQSTHAYRRGIFIGHRRNINVADNVGRLVCNMMTNMGAEPFHW